MRFTGSSSRLMTLWPAIEYTIVIQMLSLLWGEQTERPINYFFKYLQVIKIIYIYL